MVARHDAVDRRPVPLRPLAALSFIPPPAAKPDPVASQMGGRAQLVFQTGSAPILRQVPADARRLWPEPSHLAHRRLRVLLRLIDGRRVELPLRLHPDDVRVDLLLPP